MTYRLSHFLCRIVDMAASTVPVAFHWFRIKAFFGDSDWFSSLISKTVDFEAPSWQQFQNLRRLCRASIEPSKADRPFRFPRRGRLEIPTEQAWPPRSFRRSGFQRTDTRGNEPRLRRDRKCYLFQQRSNKDLNRLVKISLLRIYPVVPGSLP